MNRIAALLIALVGICTPARAHVCDGLAPTGPASFVEAQQELITCAPSQMGGTGVGATLRGRYEGATFKGVVGWMHCPTTNGDSRMVFLAATPAMMTAAAPDAAALLLATDKVTALRAFADKHGTVAIDDPTLKPLWCPLWSEIIASTPKRYIVRALGTATYRSTYPVTPAGSRNPTATSKIRILQADGTPTRCNCFAARTVETTLTGQTNEYCAVTANPVTVANCKPRP